MKLNRELSQQAGWELSTACWTIALDAVSLFSIVHFNFHERSELTSIFTSSLTSETSINLNLELSYFEL